MEYQHSYDLVEPMQYLYVKVVRARNLAPKGADDLATDPYVKVSVGDVNAKTHVIPKDLNPEWNRVFAFSKDNLRGQFLEISVWDADMVEADDFLGARSFLLEEIPSRKAPESPLSPLWYNLEERPGKTGVKGEILMALWMGNQADEAFQEAWQPDTGEHAHLRSKVYLSPKLWYLRAHIIEAEDLLPPDNHRQAEPFVEISLGLIQTKRVRVPTAKGTNPVWNKDVLFVAAEPFEELLRLTVKDRVSPNKEEVMGVTRISLAAVPRRLDFRRQMNSSWFVLDSTDKGVFRGRIHLRLHFEGGYHVFDEPPDFSSCTRPTAKQLQGETSLGVLELGVIGANNLPPMHSVPGGRGSIDAYCVAKYSAKWIRTRTITENFNPKWNEQYNWEVYDPSTVLTVGVFDNRHVHNGVAAKAAGVKDNLIGTVQIRLSTLMSGRVYTNSYPLRVVTASGIKKMGELECSVRFSCASTVKVMQAYLQPPLPAMHYFVPIDLSDLENLRIGAMNLVASRLARFEPPLRQEVVQSMLDPESHRRNMRSSKADCFRIASVLSGLFQLHNKLFDDICTWKNPVITVLVHILLLILVWYPELLLPIWYPEFLLPTVILYMFLMGAWNYRFRSRLPPPMDGQLSQGRDEPTRNVGELEEELNVGTGSKAEQVVKTRTGRSGRIQNFLDEDATLGERLHSLLGWGDPRATSMFVTFCLIAFIVLYLTSFRIVSGLLGVYVLRHPTFRGCVPPAPLNFFRRLCGCDLWTDLERNESALEYQHSYEREEPMQDLYVKIVRARNLAAKGAGGTSSPYVKASVGNVRAKTQVIPNNLNPEWNRVFAFSKNKLRGQFLEISVWDADMVEADDFLGALSFLLEEIPSFKPPQSPLAPLWYELEERPGKTGVKGEILMALWMGNQANDVFQEAWQSDTGEHAHLRSKVYLPPKLWYLRAHIIEAQDLLPPDNHRQAEPFVEINLGLVQTKRVHVPTAKGTNPVWNKDVLFVAAEPFEELLQLTVKDPVGPNKEEIMGVARISLAAVPRRLDFRRQMNSSWFVLDSTDKGVFRGRIHVRLYFEGGYHVFDESPGVSSCTKPTAKQLWKTSLGVLELGVIGANNLPRKHSVAGGRGSTDAYCVAKYGLKWIRTRTVTANCNPKWSEQCTFEVYDPSTVLTVGVFDNRHVHNGVAAKAAGVKDNLIGTVQIRLSTLMSGRVYTNSYPLRVVTASGIKKMGELECSVRFSCASTVKVMQAYLQPPLPAMHYFVPIDLSDLENLRIGAMNLAASRLARFEPPLRQEVVQSMLDPESHRRNMRSSKADCFRIASVLSGLFQLHNKLFDDICTWKNPVITVLVHILLLILVWYPELLLPIWYPEFLLPTVILYMFLMGAWNYRFRSRLPPSMDAQLSQSVQEPIRDLDELEEELNVGTGNKTEQVVKTRYGRLRGFAGRIRNFLGEDAILGERLHSLLGWGDPRLTSMFVTFCLIAAIVLNVISFRIVAGLLGAYVLRHPKFRGPVPPAPLNFFRRLCGCDLWTDLERNESALEYQHSYEREERMQYLYVKVDRARNLAPKVADDLTTNPYVKVSVGDVNAKTQIIPNNLNPKWNRVFAFSKDNLHGQFLEISVWDANMVEKDDFLGALSFLLEEIPSRKAPESPLATLWYKLEERPGKTRVKGEMLMALWMGNKADEARDDIKRTFYSDVPLVTPYSRLDQN